MPEILTESFCERCGTKYTLGPAEEPRKPAGMKKAKLLARGFKNFVMSDDAFEDALAAAELDEDRERAAEQLEAFHQVFNFCMECRQYTCTQCWNNTEGRCLTCAPLPFGIEKDPLFRLGDLAPGAGTIRPAEAEMAHPTVVDASAWPTADLARARPTPPADLQPLGLPEWLAQSAAREGAPAGDGQTGEVPQLTAGEAPPQAAAAAAAPGAQAPDIAQQPPQQAFDIAAQSTEQQAAPAIPREVAAAPEAPLPSELAPEPESAEDTARRAALDELVTDLTGGTLPTDFAAPAAWTRAGERPAEPVPEAAPATPPAVPQDAGVPGAAFEVQPTAAEIAAAERGAPAKTRKRSGRGQRTQPVGPLPGMSWQAWRATVARRDGAEVEEPLDVEAPAQPAPSTLHEGMILEPIVPEIGQHPDWAAADTPPADATRPGAVQPAEAPRAPEQPEESMPATRILERLFGAFGRSHAEPRTGQPAAPPAASVTPAAELGLRGEPAAGLPDAIGFPEPEPLGHAQMAGQPFAEAEERAEVPAPGLQRPAWPPVEPAAEPAIPSVEDEPLELPQVAGAEPVAPKAEPVAPWGVAPEAPKAPAAEPSWPPAPRQEPAWPAAPRRDAWPPAPAAPAEPAPSAPAWPPAPVREPVWPPRAPVYQPPAAEPVQAPARPGRAAPAPQQPAPPPAFVARQAQGPASWPPPAASAAQPTPSSVWDESSRGIIGRPGSGVQACVSCGLALSASARFCRRCGTRQA
jgi:hypothetical protein